MNEIEIRQLFSRCVAALNYRALRFEVRERPFALLLAVESFGRGQEFGLLDVRGWRFILCENDDKSIWRLAEIHRLLKVFVSKGWLVVDAGAGTYRLRPDQWPCWAHVCALIGRRDVQRLNFIPEADLNSMLALLSQQTALTTDGHGPTRMPDEDFSQAWTAKVSQSENFSHRLSRTDMDAFAPVGKPPEPPPPPLNPTVFRSFESVDLVAGRVVQSAKVSQASNGLDPSTHNRAHDQQQKSTSGPSRDAAMERSPNRVGDGGHRPPLQTATAVTLCTLDGYIAEKLARHPKGERLRRELAGQSTFTAQAFQRHFERNPDQAREDLGWFLEANNPNARMNTHMAGMMPAAKTGKGS